MRLLYDAVLPQSLAFETSAELELRRWNGADESDTDFVRASANRGYDGVILFGRDSLEQPELREAAREAGVALVAVAADDPIKAKHRILNNMSSLRRKLRDHTCLLVLAREVRPL